MGFAPLHKDDPSREKLKLLYDRMYAATLSGKMKWTPDPRLSDYDAMGYATKKGAKVRLSTEGITISNHHGRVERRLVMDAGELFDLARAKHEEVVDATLDAILQDLEEGQ